MIYTFYSFKGGVGRSMAMASVAWLLARRGLRVLAIDFDLEAPGLERYFFNDERALEDVRGKPGLIDLLLTYKRALTSEAEFQRAEFKDWRRYTSPAIPNTPEGGSVDLMSSGRRHPHEAYAQYALNVRAFDWQDFFHNWQGGGFFDWLRRALTDRQLDPQNAYDVVLVDSRTGVTEMGGVCAYQLADVAVLLCAPNYQNMDGTRAVLQDFRSDAVIALRQGRPLELVLLPARVEPSDQDKRRQFFDTLRGFFGLEGLPRRLMQEGLDYERLAVPYQKELAIIERVVDEGAEADERSAQTQTAIRRSFETLTDALLLLAEGARWDEAREAARARLRGTGEAPAAVQADVSLRGAGYDAFIVAHPQEWILAASIAASLTEFGLDVVQERGALEGPGRRDQALSQLQLSRMLLVCIGEAPPSDAYWQCYRQAQSGKVPKPIVSLLLAGPGGREERLRAFGLGADTPTLDLRERLGADGNLDQDALQELRVLLQPQAPKSDPRQTAAAEEEFYPGHDAYSEDQAGLLFGRDEDAERLFTLVRERRVVVLEGSPGVGKNSLINAGLLPRLRSRGMEAWRVVPIKLSGPEAEGEVKAALSDPRGDAVLYVLYAIDSFPLGGGAEVRGRRREWVSRFLELAADRSKLLLVWCGSLPEGERDAALKAWLGEGADPPGLLRLGPLAPKAQREAIERPAARSGHLFEPGLVDRLIRDAGTQPGAMAQVQLALRDIWAARRRGWLTNRAYDEGGGIAGRFDQRLAEFVEGLDPKLEWATRALFKNLVRFDGQLALSAQPLEWEILASIPAIAHADAESLRDRLASARLIDFWRAEDPQAGRELLWCALAQPVPGSRIEAWARVDVEFLLWRQRLRVFVDRDSLIAAAELDAAEGWAKSHADQLSRAEKALIDKSVATRDALSRAEQKRERERARLLQQRVRLLGGGIVVTLVLLAVAGWLYADVRRQADELRAQHVLLQAQVRDFNQQLSVSAAQRAEREKLAADLADLQEKLRRLNEEVNVSTGVPEFVREANAAVQRQAQDLPTAAARPMPKPGNEPSVRVYIQIADESQRAAARALQWRIEQLRLGDMDVVVPGIERVKSSVSRSVLRCFDSKECQQQGGFLLAGIGRELRNTRLSLEDLSTRYGKLDTVRPLHFELWLAPGALSLAQPPPALLGFSVDVFECSTPGSAAGEEARRLRDQLLQLGAKPVRVRPLDAATRERLKVRAGVQVQFSSDDADGQLAVKRLLGSPAFEAARASPLAVAQQSPGYLSVFVCPQAPSGY